MKNMMTGIFVLACCATGQAQVQVEELGVEILEIKRGSAVYRENVQAEWKPLREGDRLAPGAWIQTGLKTLVYAKFHTTTVIQIRSATLVQLAEGHRTANKITGRLNLALGAVKVQVDPNRTELVDFKVKGPRITTSVKGTGFLQIAATLVTRAVEKTFHGIVKVSYQNAAVTFASNAAGNVTLEDLSGEVITKAAGGNQVFASENSEKVTEYESVYLKAARSADLNLTANLADEAGTSTCSAYFPPTNSSTIQEQTPYAPN
jgi:hypothetical protein